MALGPQGCMQGPGWGLQAQSLQGVGQGCSQWAASSLLPSYPSKEWLEAVGVYSQVT